MIIRNCDRILRTVHISVVYMPNKVNNNTYWVLDKEEIKTIVLTQTLPSIPNSKDKAFGSEKSSFFNYGNEMEFGHF